MEAIVAGLRRLAQPCESRTALQNAASIAGLILTTDCVVASIRPEGGEPVPRGY